MSSFEGNPTLVFYTSQMDLTLARLRNGGKLSGDPDEEEAPPWVGRVAKAPVWQPAHAAIAARPPLNAARQHRRATRCS